MSKLPSGWLNDLPRNRLLAEFSMWSADLIRLSDDLERIADQADILHVDVADGHFAPALLFFPDLVARMRSRTTLPIHVHLMVMDAVLLEQIDQFAEAGADLISLHAENAYLEEGLERLQQHGVARGVVVKVESPLSLIAPYLDRLDMLTLLGTVIGVKGLGLDPSATARLGEAKRMIAGSGRRILLGADGGIRENTVPLLRAAGAETVVMGSLAFGAPDLSERIRWLRAL